MWKVQLTTSLLKHVALPQLEVYQPQGLEAKAQDAHCSARLSLHSLCYHTPWGMAESRWRRQRARPWDWTQWAATVTLHCWWEALQPLPETPQCPQASCWPSSHMQRLQQSDMTLVLSQLETESFAGVKYSAGQFLSFGVQGQSRLGKGWGLGALGRWPAHGALTASGPAALGHSGKGWLPLAVSQQ